VQAVYRCVGYISRACFERKLAVPSGAVSVLENFAPRRPKMAVARRRRVAVASVREAWLRSRCATPRWPAGGSVVVPAPSGSDDRV
jgi:hypothetical protein